MRLAVVCTPLEETNLALARQISCQDIVYYNMDSMPVTVDALNKIRIQVEKHGLRLSVVEGGPPMDHIVAGTEGRDEQIRTYCDCIRNMGQCGVRVLCYNFMHWGCRVGRTSYEVPIRGGALSSAFQSSKWDDTPTKEPKLTRGETWENLRYFLEKVVPVAEEAGVMLAMHPDDPPIASLRGYQRIMNTIEDFEKLV